MNKISFSAKPLALAFSAAFSTVCSTSASLAQTTVELGPVVVSAARVEQNSFDVPGAIDSIGKEALRNGQMGVNLSESLWRAPGTVILNRQNYAQDLQVSIRGFGARSAFGVRGVRLVQDGIPLTMPDGQGQTGSFDLSNANRVEVLRGPFSAAYGNSSGGVVQLFTDNPPKEPVLTASASGAAFGTYNLSTMAAGQAGSVGYALDAGQFHTDGYRDHSAATRNSANAKLKLALDADLNLTLLGSWLNQPRSEDALGLTQAQYDANPRQAGNNALSYNTRKEIQQLQGGANLEKLLGNGDSLNVVVWSGKRHVLQFQSTPATSQQAALATPLTSQSPGGVVDFDREYGGAGLRFNRNRDSLRLTAGVDLETMVDQRKGYQNFTGNPAKPTATGVVGALRRDEDDKVQSLNTWVQGEWRFSPNWSTTAGLRNTRVHFSVSDHYLADGSNGSGSQTLMDTSPAVGLLWRAAPEVNVFANWGQGFETPTFNEMFYRSGPGGPGSLPGVNFDLKPSRSRNMELGVKAFVAANTRVDLTWFDIETQDEIVTDQNSGGRTSYRNAGRTNRHGIEFAADAQLGHGFSLYANYTRMAAYYRDSTAGITAGKTLPAVPVSALHGEVAWRYPAAGFTAALEAHHMGRMYANDANTAIAEAYSLFALRLTLNQKIAQWDFKEYLRGDNLQDRKYVGSVIVNNANAGYFEPGPGRAWTVGVTAAYRY